MRKPSNRKQAGRQNAKGWEGLPALNRNAGGIDVGNAERHMAVPVGRDEQPVQKFRSFTADLHRMAAWLALQHHL